MRSLFQNGYKCAEAGRLWISSRSVERDDANRDGAGAGHANQCPAEDEFLGNLAVR